MSSLPEPDAHPAGAARFVGRPVSFDDIHGGRAERRLVGMVDHARYVGRTKRGAIPDYELTVRGASGKTVTVSLVENYVIFQ